MTSHVVFYIAVSFGVVIASVILAIYTYARSARKDIALRFGVWAGTIAVIALFEGLRKLYGLAGMQGDALLATKMTQVGALLFTPAFVEFCHYFPPKKSRFRNLIVISSIAFSGILIIINLTTNIITEGLITTPIGYSTDYGPGLLFFGLFFIAYNVGSFFHLALKTWRRASYYRSFLSLFGAIIATGMVINFVPPIQEALFDPPSIPILSVATLLLFSNIVLFQRFLIIPVAELSLKTPLRYPLKEGRGYVVYEKKPGRVFEILEDLLDHGYAGLCISRLHPNRLREEWRLHRSVILWLSEIDAENTVHPRDLSSLRFYIKSFSESVKNTVVVIQGLDYVIDQNGFKKTLRFIQRLNDHVAQNKAVLLVSVSRELSHEERMGLEVELETL